MPKNLNDEVKKILRNAEKEMFNLNHPYVGSEHLLLSLLKRKDEISSLLNDYDLTYTSFKKELVGIVGKGTKKSTHILYTPLLKRIISKALINSKSKKSELSSKHLISAIIEEGEGIALRIIYNMNIDIESIYDEISKITTKSLLVFEYGTLLNNTVDKNNIVIGRDEILDNMIEILLRKNKNNPLLIGEAGVGKTAIIEELTRRIIANKVPKELLNKQIVMLEMTFLVANTKYRGEFEERLNKIISEIKANPDIIVFIDEIHTLVGAGGAEGAIDASNILKPYLARGDIKCIGATTINEYEKTIAKDKALERRFQTILVKEPTMAETKNILMAIKKNYEKHYHVKITKNNIEDIIYLTDKYIYYHHNPDKAIDVLDTACSKIKCHEKTTITKNDILDVISNKTNIKFDKKNILNLEINLKNKLDSNHIKKIINLLKSENNIKPKSILLSSDDELINIFKNSLCIDSITLDMNEYSDYSSLSKLLGTSQGYVGYNDKYVLSSLKNNSFQLIIINNTAMCSKKMLNIIESIIKEGHIKDGKGDTIYFYNSIILINNQGNDKNNIGFNNNIAKKELSHIEKLVDVIIYNKNNYITN